MLKRKTNSELGHILGLLVLRLDRLERKFDSVTKDNFGKDELLDSRDIRILTKMSDRSILRRRNDGTLPYFRHGGKIYYRKSDVLKAIQQSREQSLKK